MDAVDLRPSRPVVLVASALVLALLGLVTVLAVAFVFASAEAARSFPEFRALRLPLLTLAVGWCVASGAGLAIVLALITRIARGRMLRPGSLRLVDALTGCLALGAALVAAALTLVPGPPPLGFALLALTVGGLALAAVVLVLRSLLRRAIALHDELDEVV